MIILGWILLGAGTLFTALAALGVFRLPDVFSRMHAASKSTALGVSLLLLGVGVLSGEWSVFAKTVLGAVFLVATQPVAGHVLGRAAHRAGVQMWEGTRWDDLRAGVGPDEIPDPRS